MIIEDGGIFQKYEEELEMNNFPQQVEGNQEALAQFSEYSEASRPEVSIVYEPQFMNIFVCVR